MKHSALIYERSEELLDVAVPFVGEGLDAGEAVIAALRADNLEALRGKLGRAGAGVRYVDAAQWYRRPAHTLAAYHAYMTSALDRGAPAVRILGEPAWPDGPDHLVREWRRYESSLNRVLEAFPVDVICPYDATTLPQEVVEGARRTHPALSHPDGERASEAYVVPEELLLRDIVDGVPPAAAATVMVRGPSQIREARMFASEQARAAGVGERRIEDVALGVSELTTNALRHGRTPGRVSAWTDREAFLCQVDDDGFGITDPLAGYRPPEGDEGGWGLWTARQACDLVELWNRPAGGASARLYIVPD